MEEVWETIRLEQGHNTSPKRDKSYSLLFVWAKEKNNKKQ